MKRQFNGSSDSVTRVRIMNAATKVLLKNGTDTISMQELCSELNLERAFVRRYFSSVDNLIGEIINELLKDIETILITFVSGELVPSLVNGDIDAQPDRMIFSSKIIAEQFGKKVLDHWTAILDHIIIRREAYRLLVNESLSGGKRRGSLCRLHRLFVPCSGNPVFEKTPLKGWMLHEMQCFCFLESNVFPILNYALLYDELNGCFTLKDDMMRKAILSQIALSNRHQFDGETYFFSMQAP